MVLPINASGQNTTASSTKNGGSSKNDYFLNPVYRDKLNYLQKDTREGSKIVNVWVYNFETELARISAILD